MKEAYERYWRKVTAETGILLPKLAIVIVLLSAASLLTKTDTYLPFIWVIIGVSLLLIIRLIVIGIRLRNNSFGNNKKEAREIIEVTRMGSDSGITVSEFSDALGFISGFLVIINFAFGINPGLWGIAAVMGVSYVFTSSYLKWYLRIFYFLVSVLLFLLSLGYSFPRMLEMILSR